MLTSSTTFYFLVIVRVKILEQFCIINKPIIKNQFKINQEEKIIYTTYNV